jgi:hypothetical protein
MDVATAVRRHADTTAQQVLDRAAAAGQEVTRRVQTGYSLMTLGAIDYQRKLLEITQGNANAVFDYAQELINAGSAFEMAEISSRYARQQFSAMAEHARELAAGFQTVTADVVREAARETGRSSF